MAVLTVMAVFPFSGFTIDVKAGTVDCFAYNISDTGEATITSCDKTSSGVIIVPDEVEGYPVTAIQNYAFQNCVNVTGIILPDTLVTIGVGAFMNSGIESIVIPIGVTSIPTTAFKNCTFLASIELPEGIIELGSQSFGNCSALTEIVLPESLQIIGSSAFFECKELASVNLPEGLTEIGAEAFNGCVKLASDIVIPEGVTKINTNIFRNCNMLNSLTLHDNITEIGSQPFLNCSKLQPIKLPENLITVSSNAFYFQDVQLPLPPNIETIGNMAFYKADFFDENGEKASVIDIPEKVKTIGKEAFLTSSISVAVEAVNIPASVESIGADAFNYPLFNVDSANAYYYSDEYGVLYDKDVTDILRVPYYTDKVEYVIPETVTTIETNAFGACVFSKITIPASLTSIGDASFKSCTEAVFEVDENNQNYSADENGALYNKDFTTLIKYPQIEGNTNVELPESVTVIDKYAFYGDKIITSLTMGNNIVEIKDYALSACKRLKEIHFSESLETIGNYAFYGTNQDAFTHIELPDSVTHMGSNAFNGTCLQSITIPSGVTVLDSSLFSGCSKLESVVIHKGVTEIKGYVFSLCSALKDIYYSGTEEQWAAITISTNGNSILTNATIHYNYGKTTGTCGDLVWGFNDETNTLSISGSGDMPNFSSFEEYGWSYFKDNIEFIEFANTVTSVGSHAFNGCTNLKEVFLGRTVVSVGENAFANCPSLAIVTVYSLNFSTTETSFLNNDDRLMILHNAVNIQAEEYAVANGLKSIPLTYDYENKVMNYKGELTVYSDLPYMFLSKFVKQYPAMEYLYFEKIIFDGVEPETINVEELENDASAEYLTFNNLYVSLKAVKDKSSSNITFDEFLTLLENGDYDAFMFELKSDEGKQQLTIEELWEKVTDHFISNALRITSKLINFFRKIFK